MVFILILPVLFSGLRALHPHPMVFKFILRVLFLSLGNPGGGGGLGFGRLRSSVSTIHPAEQGSVGNAGQVVQDGNGGGGSWWGMAGSGGKGGMLGMAEMAGT